jgi:hypothetical protein
MRRGYALLKLKGNLYNSNYTQLELSSYSTATNPSNSYSNDMLTVKLSGFLDMHWRDLFTSTRR